MTPQELKNSILQLAIQGKLVEQRPEEGTAEELYRQIQVEKLALIKAGKIKKEKPLPEITDDEIPFDIPESWKWVRPQELASIVVGATPSTSNPSFWSQGSIAWLPSGCCQDCEVLPTSPVAKLITQEAFDSCSTKMMPPDTIMIALTGATAGKVGLLRFEACGNQSIVGIIPFGLVSAEFFFYQLMARRREILSDCVGSAQPHISKEYVLRMLFPLPPLEEQKRIVAKIEELLPLIDRYEKAWTRLEDFNKRFPGDMQKSILQMAIQGKLVEQRPEEGTGEELYQQIQKEKQALIKAGKIKKEKPLPEITEDEIPFDIPESWKWVRFLSVVDIATNLVHPAGYSEYMHIAPDNIEKGTGKLLECRTVAEDKVASANHLFYKGQIVYSKIRPLLRKAVIAPFDGLCSADMYPLNTQLDSAFLLHYILSDAYNHQIALAMSSRVKMPKINQDELGKVLLPLPPLAEQKRIVARLEELLPLCERLKQRIVP